MSRYTSHEFVIYKGVRMTEEMAGKLAWYAGRHDVSEGEVIREALGAYLGMGKVAPAGSLKVKFYDEVIEP